MGAVSTVVVVRLDEARTKTLDEVRGATSREDFLAHLLDLPSMIRSDAPVAPFSLGHHLGPLWREMWR